MIGKTLLDFLSKTLYEQAVLWSENANELRKRKTKRTFVKSSIDSGSQRSLESPTKLTLVSILLRKKRTVDIGHFSGH